MGPYFTNYPALKLWALIVTYIIVFCVGIWVGYKLF